MEETNLEQNPFYVAKSMYVGTVPLNGLYIIISYIIMVHFNTISRFFLQFVRKDTGTVQLTNCVHLNQVSTYLYIR